MDKDYFNMGGFGYPPYNIYEQNVEQNVPQMDNNTIFNPLMQYEQAYMYYRYLSQQMEYKIKCKEYEKLSSSFENLKGNARKVE